MRRITKSIVIDVPANIIYDAYKKIDASRYTSDLTGETSPAFSKDIPNALLGIENRGSWGAFISWESSLRPLNDKSSEVTLKTDYK